jgi:lysophospholipase L1-like esterase
MRVVANVQHVDPADPVDKTGRTAMTDKSNRIRRILLHARGIWLGFGVSLLPLVVLEGMLSLAYVVRDRVVLSATHDSRVRADAHAADSWVGEYYKEFADVTANRWVSYVYWRREPYRGRYINIDANGLRRTWTDRQDSAGQGDPLTIFMFGGSTMWGVGARDDFTIPSALSRKLKERGVDNRVVNFGEAGYVSTQEVIALLRQLHAGNVPSLVVFYDGVNDVYSAYQQQVAGLPQNEFNRVREFNLSQPRRYRQLRRVFLRRAVDQLAMTRLVRNVLRRLGVADHREEAAIHPRPVRDSTADEETLFRDVVAIYGNTVQTVVALGQSYGFKALFYWQPTVFDKERLTPYEESERQRMAHLQRFYWKVSGLVQQGGLATEYDGVFHDVGGIFDAVSQPVFVDWCHICERGNEVIAERMAADIMGLGLPTGAAPGNSQGHAR